MHSRSTDLPFSELMQELEHPSHMPRCGIINELGLMAMGDGDEPQLAEEELVKLLSSSAWKDRWIAIRCLNELIMVGGGGSDTTKLAVANFEQDPANTDLLPD